VLSEAKYRRAEARIEGQQCFDTALRTDVLSTYSARTEKGWETPVGPVREPPDSKQIFTF
jgi:hypothetical protein